MSRTETVLHTLSRGDGIPGLAPGGSVLVVDDEPGIRAALGAHFARKGWRVCDAGSAGEARRRLEEEIFDLVVSDIRMPDGDGTEVLRCAQRLSPEASTILLTAFGSVPDAVAAMRMGAGDYLIKPVVWEQLESTAARLLAGRTGKQQAPAATAGILGRSPRLLQSLSRARAAGAIYGDVLIEAESGTGKELLARFIHAAGSCAQSPFLMMDCGAIPEHLPAGELFGRSGESHSGGAQGWSGRFALPAGGTLLLDEVGRLPLHLQPQLLRLLQERETEVTGDRGSAPRTIRVIATTSNSLAEAASQGRFRSDLYYRLNVIPLTLPPLRERQEDIALLARAFAEETAIRMLRPVPLLTPEFVRRLEEYAWPGNVSELRSFVQRVLSLHRADTIDGICFDLEGGHARGAVSLSAGPAALPPVGAGAPIREMERRHLENTLAMTRGNRTQAAEMLGISLRTVRNRIREYGLPPRRYA
jgi:DNA-binding NtrC family response regulator